MRIKFDINIKLNQMIRDKIEKLNKPNKTKFDIKKSNQMPGMKLRKRYQLVIGKKIKRIETTFDMKFNLNQMIRGEVEEKKLKEDKKTNNNHNNED
jgi:hypothetical protein